MTWRATVLTCSRRCFRGRWTCRCSARRSKSNLWSLDVRDIREHGLGKHRTVDDTPSGGGPGMVMRADVACAAIDAVERGDRAAAHLSLAARLAAHPEARARAARRARARSCCAAGSKDWTSAPSTRASIEEICTRRFRAGRRRDRGHGADRGGRSADPGRSGRPGLAGRRELQPRLAGISAIHPPPELRGPGHPGGANSAETTPKSPNGGGKPRKT